MWRRKRNRIGSGIHRQNSGFSERQLIRSAVNFLDLQATTLRVDNPVARGELMIIRIGDSVACAGIERLGRVEIEREIDKIHRNGVVDLIDTSSDAVATIFQSDAVVDSLQAGKRHGGTGKCLGVGPCQANPFAVVIIGGVVVQIGGNNVIRFTTEQTAHSIGAVGGVGDRVAGFKTVVGAQFDQSGREVDISLDSVELASIVECDRGAV